MAKFDSLNKVEVMGCVTHGHTNGVVCEDNKIKTLVGKSAGAYGRHWVYGDRDKMKRASLAKDGVIVVVYGNEPAEHVTFEGTHGLPRCLEFLETFDVKEAQ